MVVTVTLVTGTEIHSRSHIQRIDQAQAASSAGAEISARFKFAHPVFAAAECPVYLSKEKYVLTFVERILSRFGVDKVRYT